VEGLTRTLAVAAIAATFATPAATAAARAAPVLCRGEALTVVFRVVPGSAGAGNISYNLQLRNHSKTECFVFGLPKLSLRGRYGRALPTHVVAARPTQLAMVRVLLRPGGYAAATARFSPDVPGPGEPAAGNQCERTAYKVLLEAPGGGSAVGLVVPPTPVCEHGSLQFSAFVAGKLAPQTG
jgi:Protein of unknown function (DUF4232)